MWLLVAILGLPMVEIALFVVIGGEIGLWATLGWVVLSAVLGVFVMRLSVARQAVALRGGLKGLRDPAQMAAGGMLSLLGGALLILPGFFTDGVGILLLLPPVQMLLTRRLLKSGAVFRAGQPQDDDIIEGEFTEEPPKSGPSGWTRLD